MSLDTPERVKYFGLRSQRTCGTCRLRRGRSVTRISTRHNSVLLEAALDEAEAECHTRPAINRRKRKRDQVLRHGWNWERRCRLLDYAKNCLVHVRGFGSTVYGGLINYDRLHVWNINKCTYCMELLASCVPKECYATVAARVKACHQFRFLFHLCGCVCVCIITYACLNTAHVCRNPVTGSRHRRLTSVLHMTNLTAERRVRAIFYWAHVLGPAADIMPERLKRHALTAVATLQILLIATRGHRSYTRRELDFIHHNIGNQFYTSLEALSLYEDEQRIQKGNEAHRKQPERNRPPVPFKKERRSCLVCT